MARLAAADAHLALTRQSSLAAARHPAGSGEAALRKATGRLAQLLECNAPGAGAEEQAKLATSMLNLGREPRWRSIGSAGRGLPPDLAAWLTAGESLTRHLQGICGDEFMVELRGQRWSRPLAGERAELGMPDRAWALVRQVYLCCGPRRLVYARTVMPRSTLQGRRRRYARLGRRPLGEVLFAFPDVRRGPLEVAMLAPGDVLHDAALEGRGAGGDSLWARRSVLTVAGHPLLISEVFMPAITRIGAGIGAGPDS